MKSDVFCFLAGDANIILNMNWLVAVTTLTVHTLFTCYPLKNWTPEGQMSDSCSDALQNRKETAVYSEWLILQQPVALSSILNTGHSRVTQRKYFFCHPDIFFPECVIVSESLIFTDPQGCWAAEDPVEFMSLQHLHDEIYSLIGRRALTDRGAVFRPVARQFSLIAKCLFYNHITFSSL